VSQSCTATSTSNARVTHPANPTIIPHNRPGLTYYVDLIDLSEEHRTHILPVCTRNGRSGGQYGIQTSPRCPKAPKQTLSAFLAWTRESEPDWLAGPVRFDNGCYFGWQAPTRRSFDVLIIEFACFTPTKTPAPVPIFMLSRIWNCYEYFLDLSDLMPFFHVFFYDYIIPLFPAPLLTVADSEQASRTPFGAMFTCVYNSRPLQVVPGSP